MANKPTVQTVTAQAQNNAYQINKATDQLAEAIVPLFPKDGSEVMTGDLDLGGLNLVNLGTPSNDTDGATKAYVDDNTGNAPFYAAQASASAAEASASASSASTSADSAEASAQAIAGSATQIATNTSDIESLEIRYDADNVELLLTNDTSTSPGEANIGRGFESDQVYGKDAQGNVHLGLSADGDVHVGSVSTGNIYIGYTATGGFNIGSTEGNEADKKLISPSGEATFQDIITVANAGSAIAWGSWVTVPYAGSATVPTSGTYRQSIVVRKSTDNKNIQISGAFNRPSGINTVATLPSGYRPLNAVGITGGKMAGDYQACQIYVDTDGSLLVYNDDNLDILIEAILPLD